MVVIVACGDHVETHQDVEWQREHRQIPAGVNRCQGTGHNRAEIKQSKTSFVEKTQAHEERLFAANHYESILKHLKRCLSLSLNEIGLNIQLHTRNEETAEVF